MALAATMIHSIVETKREKPELVIPLAAVSPKMISVKLKCMSMAMGRLSVRSYTHTIGIL